MDPVTIGALATGVAGIVGGIGAIIVAVCRTQKNDGHHTETEENQDAVRLENHGSKVVSLFWGCFSYEREPDTTVILNETDSDNSEVGATRSSRGYNKPPVVAQPQLGAAAVPGAAGAVIAQAAPAPAAQVQQPEDTLLGDVNMKEFPQLADNKNHYKIDEATSNPDGSWTLKGLEFAIVPTKPGSAGDTNYYQDISKSVMPGIKAMVSQIAQRVTDLKAPQTKSLPLARVGPIQPINDGDHDLPPREIDPLLPPHQVDALGSGAHDTNA